MGRRLVFGDDRSTTADEAWLWIHRQEWPGWTIDVVTARHGRTPGAHPVRGDDAAVAARLVNTVTDDDAVSALRTSGRDSDLLVIGHKGHGLRKTLHLGSVAEALVHDAPAPLVIVRGGPTARRVLLAHDGSGHARATAASSAGIAVGEPDPRAARHGGQRRWPRRTCCNWWPADCPGRSATSTRR